MPTSVSIYIIYVKMDISDSVCVCEDMNRLNYLITVQCHMFCHHVINLWVFEQNVSWPDKLSTLYHRARKHP